MQGSITSLQAIKLIGASLSEPYTSELVLEFLYVCIVRNTAYILTIYLPACSSKFFAKTHVCIDLEIFCMDTEKKDSHMEKNC